MSKIYNFTAPYPPSTNRIWRVGQNRVYLSKEATQYKEFVMLAALEAGLAPLDGPVRVYMDVYRPRKRGDLGNREKILSDAMNGVAYHDDEQIVELHMRRFEDKENPRVEVSIHSLSSTTPPKR